MYDDECRRYALAFDGQGSYSVPMYQMSLGLLLLPETEGTGGQKYHLAGRDDLT
jgi:hypothetical protein